MEIRVLQYFLAVAREQSISGAAEFLHLSQPTLSRQLKDLEEELGKQLFIRGNRKITLTEDGMLLRKRAEEIVELVKKTENEITLSNEIITGDIHIGTGETDAVRLIAKTANKITANNPQIRFQIISDDRADLLERLDKGLFDFGVLIGSVDTTKYNSFTFPVHDTWGILMRRDSPLAKKQNVCPEDLWDKPLLISRQTSNYTILSNWLKKDIESLNIVATYNLIYNASLMVDEGAGYAFCLDKLINTTGQSNLCFRPFELMLKSEINMIWKKYQIFSKASALFLNRMITEWG